MSKHATKEVTDVVTTSAGSQGVVPGVLKSTAVAVAAPAFSLDDLAADAGAGSQGVKATDLQTPLVYLLQSNSGPCKKADGRHIPGAAEGMFLNNLTNELYNGENGIVVVPCFFEKNYIEWRANRGGLAGIHNADTPLRNQVVMKQNAEGKEVPTLPNGNILVETNNHYVLVINNDASFYTAMIPLAATALKPSRQWNTLIKRVQRQDSQGRTFNPASYFMSYKITSKARTKDNNSWMTWNVESAMPLIATKEGEATLPNGINIYSAAKAFEKAISEGKVVLKMDEPMDDGAAVGAVESDDEI